MTVVGVPVKSIAARECHNLEKANELGDYSLLISIIGLTVTISVLIVVMVLCVTGVQC